MKYILSLLLLTIFFVSSITADGVYSNTLEFGEVAKGKLLTQKFENIPLPASTFNLQGIQAIIVNKTSNQPFDHGFLSTCALDFTINGKKIVSFTASNINNQLTFPSPYIVPITDNVNLTVQMYTLNKEAVNVSITYYMKWTDVTSATFVKLTRTASSVVANFSSFNVPAGNGQGYTIQNSISWTSNAEAMDFQSTVSPGIISLSFIESFNNTQTVICKSTPVYSGKVFMRMTPCTNVQSLYKGATYITQAVYNDTVALKNVFGTFGFYVGYPNPHTTSSSSSSTGGHSSSSSTTGGHSSTGGSSTGGSSTGGKTSGGSSTGGSSTGGKTSGGSSTGGKTSGGSSTGGKTSGGSSSSSSSHQTSGSHGGSQSNSDSNSNSNSLSGSSQQSSDSFTTTATGSSYQPSPDSSNTGSMSTSTYTSGTSGSSGMMWNDKQAFARKVEFY